MPPCSSAEVALVRQRAVGLHVEGHDDGPVRDVQRALVGAQDDAVRAGDGVAVLRDDALRVRVEHADARHRDVDAAARVGAQVVRRSADAIERLAAERVREHFALRLELNDAGPKAARQHEQRAVLAARHRAARVHVFVSDAGQARRRVHLHDVARVVVREQQLAVVGGDRAVGVVALPMPDDFPGLAGGDDAGDGGGRRGRGRLGRLLRVARPTARRSRGCARSGRVAHCARAAARPGFCQACRPVPRLKADEGLCAEAAAAVQPTSTARASVDFIVSPPKFVAVVPRHYRGRTAQFA